MSSYYLHGICFLGLPLLLAILAVVRAKRDALKMYRFFAERHVQPGATQVEEKDPVSSGINQGGGGFTMTDKSPLFVVKAMWKLLFDIQQVLNAPPGVYGQYEISMRQRIRSEIDEVLKVAAALFGFNEPDDGE